MSKAYKGFASEATVPPGTVVREAGRSRGDWIQTFTGRQFWPLDPRAEDVCLLDIAHALAMKCRYTGHSLTFYSVAQHSVLVSVCCENVGSVEAARWGLLHDAAEAYLPDVARPIKGELVGYQAIEDRIMAVIAEVFGLELPIPEYVHQADLKLLATECRDLMAPPPRPWISIEQIEPLAKQIESWTPVIAKCFFLNACRRLGVEKND